MRGFVLRRFQRQLYNLIYHGLIERRDPRRPGLVSQQTIHTFGHEALLPAPYAGFGFARRHHDRLRAKALGCKQNDLRPPNMLLRRTARRNNWTPRKTLAFEWQI